MNNASIKQTLRAVRLYRTMYYNCNNIEKRAKLFNLYVKYMSKFNGLIEETYKGVK